MGSLLHSLTGWVATLACSLQIWLLFGSIFLYQLEEKRPIRRSFLALAEGPWGPLVTIKKNRDKRVLMIRHNRDTQGANDALIVRC